jgi:hypothetical protein
VTSGLFLALATLQLRPCVRRLPRLPSSAGLSASSSKKLVTIRSSEQISRRLRGDDHQLAYRNACCSMRALLDLSECLQAVRTEDEAGASHRVPDP